MCKYCSGEESFMNVIVENIFINEDVFFIIIGNYIYLATEDGNINKNTRWKINYCPMCGRKLGGINEFTKNN